jgi:hypothetical protein
MAATLTKRTPNGIVQVEVEEKDADPPCTLVLLSVVAAKGIGNYS